MQNEQEVRGLTAIGSKSNCREVWEIAKISKDEIPSTHPDIESFSFAFSRFSLDIRLQKVVSLLNEKQTNKLKVKLRISFTFGQLNTGLD